MSSNCWLPDAVFLSAFIFPHIIISRATTDEECFFGWLCSQAVKYDPLPPPWKIDDPRGNVHIVIQCTITVIFLNSIFKPKWLEHYYNHLEWPTVWMWSQSYALTGALVCELQFMHSLSQSVNTDTELRQDVPGPLMSLINCSVCQKTDQS